MPILKLQPEWMLHNTPQTVDTQVGDGVQGNLDTLDIMSNVARERSRHPLVRQLALAILSSNDTQAQHYADEALAIGAFVQAKVKYVRDIRGVETLIDPLTMIDQLKRGEAYGDCDDMATLIASLLLSIGHQPYFRIIKYDNNFNSGYQHVYVVDYEKNRGNDRKRIVLDAIVKHKPIGYEIKHLNGKEFAV